jgi:quinoprotein glucose dehydrogenase
VVFLNRASRSLGLRQRFFTGIVTLTKDGARIPAVVRQTKNGIMYVVDRQTGIPIFKVEERPVPASDTPLEEASRSQPSRP